MGSNVSGGSGHVWMLPDLSTCELCGDKDWVADRYCSSNPKVKTEYLKWVRGLKIEKTQEETDSKTFNQ